MLEQIIGRFDDLSGIQVSQAIYGEYGSHFSGEARIGKKMEPDSLFAVWCLVKPVAMGAMVALAEQLAEGLDTPVVSICRLASEAQLDRKITLNDLQGLSLPLNSTGLMESICLSSQELKAQMISEIAEAGVNVVPNGGFHSEYTLWRIVGDCIETLTGQQAGTALNSLLVSAGLDAQFSIEPSSQRVDKIVDYFSQSATGRCALPYGRGGVLLSTWAMPLGGFTTSRALTEWLNLLFFRDSESDIISELVPSHLAVERMVDDCLCGRSKAVLGLRSEGDGRLSCRGWMGLSVGMVDLVGRRSASALCNDLTCDPDRLSGLVERLLIEPQYIER